MEKFNLKFKVGDKVRVIEEGVYKGFVTEVIGIDESDDDCSYQIDSYKAFEEGRWFSDSDLEPYTEEPNVASKVDSLDANVASLDATEETEDNMEEKDFDLSDILSGCEGEKIFLPGEGECIIVSISKHAIELTRNGIDRFGLYNESLRLGSTGFAYAYPSEESFIANPLNARKAWQKWSEVRKSKRWRAKSSAGVAVSECEEHWEDCYYWYITSVGSIFRDEEMNCKADNLRYELGNYFRTEELAKQAANGIRDYLEKFHEQHTEQ